MMLPTLISVSVAPVSYFFWAGALPLMAAKAMTAVANAAILVGDVESIISPWFGFADLSCFKRSMPPGLGREALVGMNECFKTRETRDGSPVPLQSEPVWFPFTS